MTGGVIGGHPGGIPRMPYISWRKARRDLCLLDTSPEAPTPRRRAVTPRLG